MKQLDRAVIQMCSKRITASSLDISISSLTDGLVMQYLNRIRDAPVVRCPWYLGPLSSDLVAVLESMPRIAQEYADWPLSIVVR